MPSRIPGTRIPTARRCCAARKHIVDGEIFQVVISHRFELGIPRGPDGCLPHAARHQPQPVHVPASTSRTPTASPTAIVGSSPEALVNVNDDHVVTHPIAGSRPRGASYEDDQQHREEPAGRREGTRRAPDARRSRPQRPVQGLRPGLGGGHRVHGGRALQPHHAPRLHVVGELSPGIDGYDVLAPPSRPARSPGPRSRAPCDHR